MSRLNQVIAVAATKKSVAQSEMTKAYQSLQKPELFSGLERNYKPLDDEGQALPPESKKVQTTVDDVVSEFEESFVEMLDVVVTQDSANQEAKADVIVDDVVVLERVPVTTLLFLEKKAVELGNLVGKIPTLESSENWTFDESQGLYRSSDNVTHRTEKIQTPVRLAEATKEHPEQVQLITKDQIAGNWTSVKLSGAVPVTRKKELEKRVRDFREAVVTAREQANSQEVTTYKIGEKVFNHIFS